MTMCKTRWEYPDTPHHDYTGWPDAEEAIQGTRNIHPLLRAVLLARFRAGERVQLPLIDESGFCYAQKVRTDP